AAAAAAALLAVIRLSMMELHDCGNPSALCADGFPQSRARALRRAQKPGSGQASPGTCRAGGLARRSSRPTARRQPRDYCQAVRFMRLAPASGGGQVQGGGDAEAQRRLGPLAALPPPVLVEEPAVLAEVEP